MTPPPIHFAPASPIAIAYRDGLDGSANLYPLAGHQYTAWRLGLIMRETLTAMERLTGAAKVA